MNFQRKSFSIKIFLAIIFSINLFAANASTGNDLRSAMIWHPVDSSISVGFRKEFMWNEKTISTLFIFADSKYMLYINSEYVMRGPCRFDPKRPEYDSIDVSKFLMKGNNTIAVLCYGHVSSGDAMQHAAGLGLKLVAGNEIIKTDESWRCNNQTRFEDPTVSWDGFRENVRADKEDGDWTLKIYDDSKWQYAVSKDKKLWGEFFSRITPMSLAKNVAYTIAGRMLPFEVIGESDMNIYLELQKNIMGFVVLKFNADKGSRFEVFGHHYTAREGEQQYISADVFASGQTNIFGTDIEDATDSTSIVIHVDTGRVRFEEIQVMNFVAPLQLVGSFNSSDTMFNRFWNVIANMHAQITQDTYTDGVSEGNEWMMDVNNISHFTKVAFAGLNKEGTLNYDERRFLAKALSDVAVSQQTEGRVKAHHPSDRFDLHWFIEDFASVWITDTRKYFEQTQDTSLVKRIYPAIKKQLAWFKDSIRNNGLFHGREWCVFDNPYAYDRGEGATLNAYVYRAFSDGAYLAKLFGDTKEANEYNQIASTIKVSFNKNFWNNNEKTFRGMKDSNVTTHAAVMSLYLDICSDEHKADVQKFLMTRKQDSIIYPLLHAFWFKDLYDMNTDSADQQVLNIIQVKYANSWNAYNKGFVTSEECNGGRNFHNFGMVPGYYLSTYILGVRSDEPVWKKHILIEPRLGNLTEADGTVITENGPVNVLWKKNSDGSLAFSIAVPAGVSAEIGIPVKDKNATLIINGNTFVEKGKVLKKNVTIAERFIYVDEASGGNFEGVISQ